MPRPSNTLQRRRQIVAGLERVMSEIGYERASVAAIAASAGLTVGLIHYHFKNKQEILVELVRDLDERLAARCARAMDEAADKTPRGRLAAWLDAHVALGADAPPDDAGPPVPDADVGAVACWVVIAAEAIRQPEVSSVFTRALAAHQQHLETLLSSLPGVARLPAARRRAMSAALLATIQGAYVLGVAAPSVVPRGFARAALRAQLDGLLGAVAVHHD